MLDLIDIEFIESFPLNDYVKIEFDGKFYIFKIEDCVDEDLNVCFVWFMWVENINPKNLVEYKSKHNISSRKLCETSLLKHIEKLIEN
jgi:hypothetical protein